MLIFFFLNWGGGAFRFVLKEWIITINETIFTNLRQSFISTIFSLCVDNLTLID